MITDYDNQIPVLQGVDTSSRTSKCTCRVVHKKGRIFEQRHLGYDKEFN